MFVLRGLGHDREVGAMTSPAVETMDLSKRYGPDVLAVDGVSLRVGRGELYAFLGLNGAGKSTTIRMLLGMIRPTSGSAQSVRPDGPAGATPICGARVGHLVESATAYPELTVTREPRRRAAAGSASRDRGRRRPSDRPARRSGLRATAVPGRCRSATFSGWRSPAPCSTAPELLDPRRAGQRPGPGRRHRGPRAAPRARCRGRRRRSSCPATSWPRSTCWRRGSGSSTGDAWSRNSTAKRFAGTATAGSRSSPAISAPPRQPSRRAGTRRVA